MQQRLAHPPDPISTNAESGMTRALYDCAAIPLTAAGPTVRLVIATHVGTSSNPTVGVERGGTVYELFVSTLPSPTFTASDILDLYLHRGSFETVLADEDKEQEMDRWYSHTPCSQEFAQILAQWVWNLRLELGQQLAPAELRTTKFAPACEAEVPSITAPEPAEIPPSVVTYGPVHHNGPDPPLLMAFLAPHLLHSRMGRCVVLPIIPSIYRNDVPSAMAPCESCMLRVLVIVVPARSVRSVRRAVPRSSHDG